MNPLKTALAERRAQLGLWQALASPYTAEICGHAGYDWLLFDGEHAPNTIPTLLAQLQAVSALPVEPVARPPVGDPVLVKQYLDIGFRSLLIPMVESAEQAARMVAATRFPPDGIRGVASATSRASGFGANKDYLRITHLDICLIIQIESRKGLDAIEEIAAVEGVDALFIGPADLAGGLGHLGEPGHETVQTAIDGALKRIADAGKASGIFALSPQDARRRLEQGVAFVSLGTDIGLLANGARILRETCTS
jgi:4-hydroxy-2-oxoheptanedioate aldolase